MGVKVLSLFDGMACGMLAMQRAEVEVDEYIAYEVDKYAIKTSSHNFPMIQHNGDVFEADYTKHSSVDYLIGGSPCTFWSIAQKNNRETEASGLGWELFQQYVRALNEAKPKYFIYENNKSMSNAIRESISSTFGFDPICINSALVSAQNRQRLYWVGRRNEDGTYSKVDIDQPLDRKVLLRDILENGESWTDKSYAYTTRYHAESPHDTIQRHRHTMVAEPINMTSDDKAQCLRATCYKDGIRNIAGNNVDKRTGVAEPVRVGSLPRPNGELSQSQWFRIYDIDGTSAGLKGCSGGAGGKTGLYAIPIESSATASEPIKAISQSDGETYTVYEVESGEITIKGKKYPIKLADGYYIIRKLTVTECMRLQTVPEWYEFPVSKTQAYKMLGNGWTVDVIAHLIRSTISERG